MITTSRLFLLSATLVAASLQAQAQTAAPSPAAAAPASASAATNLDFGDFKSSTLTEKAWKAPEKKNYAEVAGYTGKCIDMFKAQAVAMQKGLTAPPATTDKDKV